MSTATGESGTSDKIALENIINGTSAPAADGRAMDIIDPSTGAVYATSPLSGAADVDRAYELPPSPTRPGASPPRASGSTRC